VLLTGREREFLQAISRLVQSNPFLPERIAAERDALGRDFREVDPIRSLSVDDPSQPDPNRVRLNERLEEVVPSVRERLASGADASDHDLALYQDAVLRLLYGRHLEHFRVAVESSVAKGRGPGRLRSYASFAREWEHFFEIPMTTWRPDLAAPHAFACLFQIQRAFHHIFQSIVGHSVVAARLRGAVWQSVFTHDLQRYRDTLYDRMGDVPTLILGPSGTGKELVARAIGFSRYIPFDANTATFTEDFVGGFHPLNLSAMPGTLIESELFGHKRGAFTGAVGDRRGWLEVCAPGGTVFLDEIGELEPAIQVKLLRVLQARTFQPLGETAERPFRGKIVAATNRDLADAMQRGEFREDFYYRLCSDVIVTPSLHEQLRDAPDVLRELLQFIVTRVTGEATESLVDEAEHWIVEHLGSDYPWPGNIRELEQCVRSVLIRKAYRPAPVRPQSDEDRVFGAALRGELTAEELLRRYCTLVYARTENYQETARRLELDRRTVKSKIDEALLTQLRGAAAS
jgi:transcriptional regulator with AAA-type ATPase domain